MVQQQNIRNEHFFRFASAKRYLKIFVPGFAFKHDDNDKGKDRFVGREIQIRRLFMWLTSDSKSGSYLITGYRGMGKSLLVKRVIDMISREPKAYKEILFQGVVFLTFSASFLCFVSKVLWGAFISLMLAVMLVLALELTRQMNYIKYEIKIRKAPLHHIFDKNLLTKVWLKLKDRRGRKYSTIAITVNLGQEVLHERDVLSLIAQNIREKYNKYVHNRQNRPITSFLTMGLVCTLSFVVTKFLLVPLLEIFGDWLLACFMPVQSTVSALVSSVVLWMTTAWTDMGLLGFAVRYSIYLLSFWLTVRVLKSVRRHVPFFSVPFNSLERLNTLCDRIASTFNEDLGVHPQYSSSFFSISFGRDGKRKSTPAATVRELEHELLSVINAINGEDCPQSYRAQFIIVFDELDKVTKAAPKTVESGKEANLDESSVPEFESSVKGFTDAMAYEERKQNVLRLLANMKLFIASVKAKCVFISGHELFDASLADLSDREFAISSIFNGVLNVSSFLSPEREQSDVSSMTELYLATMLLPESYLQQKMEDNMLDNGVLKDELPSLRWYNEYLMDIHVINDETARNSGEIKKRMTEICHVIAFLKCFCVYLSHISNGSPKKIATYFEKYVKVNYDAIRQFDWSDEIVMGKPVEKDVQDQCVLFFDPDAQKLITFIHYIASPVINAITNEVSHYGDKLLVSSSFMLDHIYKYHGKGFSWRNLEQMPELLNTNKTPELRDSMSSIMEFLLQTHIAVISSGVFQYKFHKQISEEISMLSKTSEEAAAIFNFTLNESETVKRYNTRLLRHYYNLAQKSSTKNSYQIVVGRIHENIGDIYFSEEDYYRAIHEYRSAIQHYSNPQITPNNILDYLKCSLKIGVSYEYRHTFENAYMVYCQIINNLVHLRWIEEDELGLDYTTRLTNDWRIKQTLLVDSASLCKLDSFNSNADYRRHFKSGLLEDIREKYSTKFYPEYSINSDKAISSLASNFTPEKSDLFLRLTVFEDVKFVFQAIIAKLFVIEKMEASGITQSSIDVAEAEFMTLYSTTNHDEKFIMAADFFSKLASILYYKNSFVTSVPTKDNLYAALYVYDINVLALLDDYCFKECDDTCRDAVAIKDDVKEFFKHLKFKHLQKVDKFESLLTGSSLKALEESDNVNDIQKNVRGYLKYLDNHKFANIRENWEKLKECEIRREKLINVGRRLPCNACKYAHRSLTILMKQMFYEYEIVDNYQEESKVITLLKFTSHKKVRFLRPEHLSQLAMAAEQLADILLSCACTNATQGDNKLDILDLPSYNTILFLTEMIGDAMVEEKRKELFNKFLKKNNNGRVIKKLDRVLLYYWTACRYYEIASMYHEATHCIIRVAKVIEDYLTVIWNKKLFLGEGNDQGENVINNNDFYNNLSHVLTNIFKQASKMVSRQYDNSNMVEIREFKWVFHLEHAENIDLTQLTHFTNLQPLFLSVENSQLIINRIIKEEERKKGEDDKNYKSVKEEYENHVIRLYKRIASPLRLERTFKAEVELYFAKANVNHIILVDLLGKDIMQEYRNDILKHDIQSETVSTKGFYRPFYSEVYDFLIKESLHIYEEKIFSSKKDILFRLDLIDFLIYDSLVSLYKIIKILPPHNQFTTFSYSFIALVYERLWEWSKYYEMLYDLYLYYKYDNEGNDNAISKMVEMVSQLDKFKNKKKDQRDFKELLKKIVTKMKDAKVKIVDDFGYRYSKLFMNLRHEMDDSTIHHIYTNYSAEMAIKYYRAARGINCGGQEYKNLINNMYVLDDDLRNDTCQANLADERYLMNSGVIDDHRIAMQRIYDSTKINKIDNHQKSPVNISEEDPYGQLEKRYSDSLYLNTEY